MRPVPVLSDYLVKLVIPASRAILKPAVIYRFVSLNFTLIHEGAIQVQMLPCGLVNPAIKISLLNRCCEAPLDI